MKYSNKENITTIYTGKERIFDERIAYEIIHAGQLAIREKGVFFLGISGGSTPLGAFNILANTSDSLDWSKIYIFWVDERCVAPENPDSNFGIAYKVWLNKLPVNFYRIKGEKDPFLAAKEYEDLIRDEIKTLKNGNPVFDLLLLGMGTDGHTCSLFPNTTILEEEKAIVKDVWVEKLNTNRISFTYPLVNNAKKRIIAIKGTKKIDIYQEVQSLDDIKYPIQGIYPSDSEDTWILF